MNTAAHYVPPTRTDRVFNAVVGRLAAFGINLAGARTLTVTGRTTGRPQQIPVNPLTFDGAEYLVAVRGETQWVRNVRATPMAQLGRGRTVRHLVLTETPVADRAPIIEAYLGKWGWEVGRFLPDGLAPGATVDEIAAHAHKLPVFIVCPAD